MLTLIENATIVTMDPSRRILPNSSLLIEGERIAGLGPSDEIDRVLRETGRTPDLRIDCSGKIVFPGLINTHVHSFQTLLKGLETDTEMGIWLQNVITPSVASITESDARFGAILSGLDGLHSGTTTILDYQYAQYLEGLNDASIEGYRELGLRLVYGRGFADTGVQFGANPAEIETVEEIDRKIKILVKKYQRDTMVDIALAPSAVWMCTPDLMRWTRNYSASENLLVTSHVAETEWDDECSCKIHGCGDFQACEEYGLINDRMLLVHCVQLSEEEIARASAEGTSWSYNPVSNMYLASGAAPVGLMKKHGLTGSLGTDGAASNNSNDLLETLKSAVLLAKCSSRDPLHFTALEALEYATISGAKALGMDKEIGSLEAGKKADLFIFNPLASPKSTPCHDPVAGLVYASDSRNVETVLIDGKIVLDRGTLPKTDEEMLLVQAAEASGKLRVRMADYPG